MEENVLKCTTTVWVRIYVIKLWNSKSLKYKDVSYDSITIPASGYVSLKKNGLSLSNIRMASIITYSRIDPPKPFCVYGNSTVAYVYGEPGTVITELKVRFWYWLNSNTILKSNGLRYYSANVDSKEKTVRLTFGGHFAGILIVDQNKYTNIYAVGASSGIKQISIGNADSPQPSKSGNTISIPMRAWSSFILITNDNSVIKL